MATRMVVEWTRATLRVALADGVGVKCRLRAVHSQRVSSPAELVAALSAWRASSKPRAGSAEVIGVVPREQVITRLMTFPATDPRELAQMVELYARAQLPYPREQTVTDFHVVRQHEGFSTVAIIACQRQVLAHYVAALREAGRAPVLVTLSAWGVLGWYRWLLRSDAAGSLRAAGVHEPVLIMNVDDARTDLVLVGEGRLLSSRSIGQGAQDWAASGEAAELLLVEAERTQAAVQKELPGMEARSVVLTGVGELPSWSERLSQRLGCPVLVVEAAQPFARWAGSLEAPISPVVVAGVAGSELHGLLNLSPPEVRAHVRHHEQVRELVVVGALLLGVLALGSGLLGLQAVRERRQARQLDQALAAVEPAARRLQEQSRSAQLVGGLLESRRLLAQHLAGVFASTPPEVTLEALTFERAKREVVLRGHAASTQTVLEYIKQLEQLDGVGAVQLKHSTRRSSLSGERTEFELVLRQQGAG